MKLQYMSDLHWEHQPDYGQRFVSEIMDPKDADVLVLAGDITGNMIRYRKQFEPVLESLAKKYEGKKILVVPGNHEYWGSTLPETRGMIADIMAKHSNIQYLYTGTVIELQGKRFVGDTMWFPPKYNKWGDQQWSDFRRIHDLSEWVYQHNKAFREFVKTTTTKETIIITHHLPASGSIATEYIGEATNRYFVSHMEDLICQKEPLLWIHGHTHHQFDYKLHNTRIVANPCGYPNEPTQKGFIANLIIEI